MTSKPGRFAQANNGTLFLDEIGDISPAFQVKLLRALEEGEFQPLGSTKTRKVDVRLICATNRNLEKLVEENKFREDLYYRIRVVPIEIPPLKQRREDIPLLVDHFTKLLSAKFGRPAPGFSPKTMRYFYDYNYPGNIRELRNVLERAFVLCAQDIIEPNCLPLEMRAIEPTHLASVKDDLNCAIQNSDLIEKQQKKASLKMVLDNAGWNRAKAAKQLNISRTTLWRWMKEVNLA